MSAQTIDYDALARQHGGTAAVDYDALAAQHGGTAEAPAPSNAQTAQNAIGTTPSQVYANTQKFISNNAPTVGGMVSSLGDSVKQIASDLTPDAILHPLQHIAQEINQRGQAPSTGSGPNEPTAGDWARFVANVGGQAAGLVQGREEKDDTIPGQNYTRNHAAAFEGAIAPATGMGKNFIPQNVSEHALTPIRQTAANMAQGTPTQQRIVRAATSPSTPPLQRLGAYQAVVQQSLNDLEAQHAPALAQVSATPVDTSGIVKQLQSLKSPTMDPADTSAIDRLIGRVQQAKNIGDLNTFRQELNTETAPEYRQSQVQAGRSGISAQATSDLAGWVRNSYYDNLQNATGADFAPLKRQESNLITTQEALQNQQSPLAKAEATFHAPTSWQTKAGNVANLIKDPKATVTQTALRESPATPVSTMLQKSLVDLPAPSPSAQATAAPGPGAQSSMAQLGRGQIPTVQGTPVTSPPPQPAAPGLRTPSPSPAPLKPNLPPGMTGGALPAGNGVSALPASTGGYVPTPAAPPSPPPSFNSATARMRVQPTQFNPQPTPAPSTGPIPVTPEGQAVTGALQRYTPPAGAMPPASPPASTPALKGRALWAQQGADKMTSHGVSASDVDALSKTTKGKQLLVIASGLNPGSASMKNLVQQIPAAIGRGDGN